VALDDFGAGYTSFNYLKELPADFIKIDGSFVRDINQNPANYAITRTIVDLTHELGMSSIAEWAETADTVASLIELGVDYGQGFGLARPMPKELVTQAISSGTLVRDPAVQSLLSNNDRKLITLHAAAQRRR
jgi:EAL domain-containing protein (putative c-di-GMP-specific phosphodiesterase class I)